MPTPARITRRKLGRHHMVCVRLTASEFEAIRSIAYSSGYDSPAAWVRAEVERISARRRTAEARSA